MGVQGSKTGVTLEFKDVTGTKDIRPSVKGTISNFFARQRPVAPGSTDPLFGSADWLTDIILVDQPAKLADLKATQTGDAFTSASSKKVLVQWDVGDDKGRMYNCLTVATGQQDPVTGRLMATNIIVLPPQTEMKPGHILFGLWKQQVDKLQPHVPASGASAGSGSVSTGAASTPGQD